MVLPLVKRSTTKVLQLEPLTFWECLSFRGDSCSLPAPLNRRFFAELGASRSFSCSIGRFIGLGSSRLVPIANFVFCISSLEGDRREAPSGDLVFASSGASARLLVGDVVFIIFDVIVVQRGSGADNPSQCRGYVFSKSCKWWELGLVDQYDVCLAQVTMEGNEGQLEVTRCESRTRETRLYGGYIESVR
jgi:hypothetical protein